MRAVISFESVSLGCSLQGDISNDIPYHLCNGKTRIVRCKDEPVCDIVLSHLISKQKSSSVTIIKCKNLNPICYTKVWYILGS